MSSVTGPVARPGAVAPRTRTRRRRARLGADARPGALLHALAVTLALVFVAPLAWSVVTSLKPGQEASANPPTFLPSSPSLDNYEKLLDYGAGIGSYLVNSVIVAAMTVVGTVVLSVLAGYGFSRYQFPGKRLAFALVLAILMVPYATILIPLYVVLGWFGLQNTLLGLSVVLVMFQLPFGVFMMRNSFDTVPRELEDAARIDGASTFAVLRHVSLRIVLPGIVTVAMFAFLAAWNEFLAPLIFLNDQELYTLPIMLVNVQTGNLGTVDYGALQAGVVLAMTPCVVLFLALQRFYVNGLIAGSLKG